MKKHRKKAIAFFLLVMTGTVAVTLMTPKSYFSESKIFVRLGRENAMLDSTATLGANPVVALPSSRESEINSVAEMLGSRAIIEHVVDEIGPQVVLNGLTDSTSVEKPSDGGLIQRLEELGKPWRDWLSANLRAARSALSSTELSARDRAVERLEKNLAVEPIRKSNVVCVFYKAPQPELARQVVASVVDAYVEKHVQLNRTRGTHEFFAEHAKRLGDHLSELEDELADLKTTTGLASIDEQRTQIVKRIGRLEDELLTAEAERKGTQAKVRALQERLVSLPQEQVIETNTGIGDHGTDLIRDKFFMLQVQEKEAASIYKAEHPKLRMIREELAETEQILSRHEPTLTQTKTAPDTTYEEARLALIAAEPELAAIEAKTESLDTQLASVRGSLETLNKNEIRITELKREIELCEADYRKYAANLEQARIDHAMETERMSNISVAQPASFEPRAIRPKKAVNLALGLIVAMGGTVFLPLLVEYFRRPQQAPGADLSGSPSSASETSSRLRHVVLRPNGKKPSQAEVRQRQ